MVLVLTVAVAACGGSTPEGGPTPNPNADMGPPAMAPSDECGSVRLTGYQAQDRGWCEYDRTQNFLPQFVRSGFTAAMAEPWNGSSYEGDPGEACGECWEVTTNIGSEIVMIHDLCPIQGNPLCAGGHFHIDLALDAANAVGGGLYEGSARRVPCPVTGDIHLQINDTNEFGYLRLQALNHRLPVRRIEYRAVGSDAYQDVERSGGAWNVLGDNSTFAQGGPGGTFRLTAATGAVVESDVVIAHGIALGSFHDLGVQFPEVAPNGGMCVYEPPGDVYIDAFGGISGVEWRINPWGSITVNETSDGCLEGQCLRLDNVGEFNGAHLDYRQFIELDAFSRLEFDVRTTGSEGPLVVAFSRDGERCGAETFDIDGEWQRVVLNDPATACAALPEIGGFTIDNGAAHESLFLDNVRFVP